MILPPPQLSPARRPPSPTAPAVSARCRCCCCCCRCWCWCCRCRSWALAGTLWGGILNPPRQITDGLLMCMGLFDDIFSIRLPSVPPRNCEANLNNRKHKS